MKRETGLSMLNVIVEGTIASAFLAETLALAFFVTLQYVAYAGYETSVVLEPMFYHMLIIGIFAMYRCISRRINRLNVMIVSSVVCSVFTTVIIFLINNFWKLLGIICYTDFCAEVNYGTILINDLKYSVGLAELRYPALFVGMVLLCFFGSVGIKPLIKLLRRFVDDD